MNVFAHDLILQYFCQLVSRVGQWRTKKGCYHAHASVSLLNHWLHTNTPMLAYMQPCVYELHISLFCLFFSLNTFIFRNEFIYPNLWFSFQLYVTVLLPTAVFSKWKLHFEYQKVFKSTFGRRTLNTSSYPASYSQQMQVKFNFILLKKNWRYYFKGCNQWVSSMTQRSYMMDVPHQVCRWCWNLSQTHLWQAVDPLLGKCQSLMHSTANSFELMDIICLTLAFYPKNYSQVCCLGNSSVSSHVAGKYKATVHKTLKGRLSSFTFIIIIWFPTLTWHTTGLNLEPSSLTLAAVDHEDFVWNISTKTVAHLPTLLPAKPYWFADFLSCRNLHFASKNPRVGSFFYLTQHTSQLRFEDI